MGIFTKKPRIPHGIGFPKYTFGDSQKIMPVKDSAYVKFYRLVALRDIPEHNVKAGDLGGWVENDEILSHTGSSWIGGEAKVFGPVRVMDDAFVTGNAIIGNSNANKPTLVANHAVIKDNARLASCYHVKDNACIQGNATASLSRIEDNAIIGGKSSVTMSTIAGNTTLLGNVKLEIVKTEGTNIFQGPSDIGRSWNIYSVDFKGNNHFAGEFEMPSAKVISNFNSSEKQSPNRTVKQILDPESKLVIDVFQKPVGDEVTTTSANVLAIEAIANIEKEYEQYTSDIVTLIKYPMMADSSFPLVAVFQQKLRKAKRMIASGTTPGEEFVDNLEQAFLAMEAACIKTSTHELDPARKKKINTAGVLVNMALDEASSAQEKASAAKKALDYLSGVILVPEPAVESFKVLSGLKELEV